MARILFIGGGNMARALIAGLHASVATPVIHVVDPDTSALEQLRSTFACSVGRSIGLAVGEADLVFLAVKPDQVAGICQDIRGQLTSQVVVSIAAGIDSATLSRWLGGHTRIVRAMPNTPALARCAVTGLFASADSDDADRESVSALFASVGETIWLCEERLLDAITAISGSGPAYVFYMIEATIAAAMELGLEQDAARTAAIGTFRGAVALLDSTKEAPSALRERVTSKWGTTFAALSALAERDVRGALFEAVHRAYDRAGELRDMLRQPGAGANA